MASPFDCSSPDPEQLQAPSHYRWLNRNRCLLVPPLHCSWDLRNRYDASGEQTGVRTILDLNQRHTCQKQRIPLSTPGPFTATDGHRGRKRISSRLPQRWRTPSTERRITHHSARLPKQGRWSHPGRCHAPGLLWP